MSYRLGIYGIADTIEEDAAGNLTPVEHKWGRGAGDLFPTIVQVVAQAMCLEEMTGRQVQSGAIFVVQERAREPVAVNDHRQAVADLVQEVRSGALAVSNRPEYFPRLCRSCSVLNACQPKGASWR